MWLRNAFRAHSDGPPVYLANGQPALVCSPNARYLDGGLAKICSIPRLRCLNLVHRAALTDEDLSALSAAQGLEELDVDGCDQITARGVARLPALRNLKRLGLYGLRAVEDSFGRPGAFPRLEALWFSCHSVSRLTLAHLPRLTWLSLPFCFELQALTLDGVEALEDLSLFECARFADAGVEHLGHHAGLSRLGLHGTDVTDAGVARLSEFHALEDLDLCATQITDAALPHLTRLTGLRELALERCPRLTPAGVRRLEAAMPWCVITSDYASGGESALLPRSVTYA